MLPEQKENSNQSRRRQKGWTFLFVGAVEDCTDEIRGAKKKERKQQPPPTFDVIYFPFPISRLLQRAAQALPDAGRPRYSQQQINIIASKDLTKEREREREHLLIIQMKSCLGELL